MKRQIIKIDEDLCTGCGICIPNCPEGALQIIDGKARMVCDLFCDGLGACIGHCPMGAISFEEREAEPYDERRVMENIVKTGESTIKAHLKHLKDHNQEEFYQQAVDYLKEQGIGIPAESPAAEEPHAQPIGCSGGCPGSRMMVLPDERPTEIEAAGEELLTTPARSELRQWPVQLQLLNPEAPYFKNAELVITADCVPFALPNFHDRFLKGKTLIILCPKLDQTIEQYVQKLTRIFQAQNIKTVTNVHMEVPCCGGTLRIIDAAMLMAGKKIPVKDVTVSISGEVIAEKEL